MCGIAGIFATNRRISEPLLQDMMEAISHRGPDDFGIVNIDPVALIHRRLSIIDLTSAGHQPMEFSERGLWITYNGEVYNYVELRRQLELRGYSFSSGTDTEVILKGYDAWGDAVFSKMRGMFALAIWDIRNKELILARDPFGIKPLYYGCCGSDFVFASELKALRLHPDFDNTINLNSLDYYLSHAYIPESQSIFESIQKVIPGTILRYDGLNININHYYELPAVNTINRSRNDQRDALLETLQESVRLHLIADVPVGVFLSGGIDSSAIVALMRHAGQNEIKSFSIGFENKQYDERVHARRVAKLFQTDHHEIVVSPNILDYVDSRLLEVFDEPFANPAAVIADALSSFTRSQVPVALSGVGGDELFAGYPRYIGMQWVHVTSKIPDILKRLGIGILELMPRSADRRNMFERTRRYLQVARLPINQGYAFATSVVPYGLHRELLSSDVRSNIERQHIILNDTRSFNHILESLLEYDIRTYLPGDLLTYSDRTSMKYALELRVPFCDIEVVKLARTIPSYQKIHKGILKWVLKDALRNYLPDDLLFRKKQGFSLPIGEWLSGPLRPMVHEYLSSAALQRYGLFDKTAVEQVITEFNRGYHQNGFLIWTLLVLNIWMEKRL